MDKKKKRKIKTKLVYRPEASGRTYLSQALSLILGKKHLIKYLGKKQKGRKNPKK